MMTTKYLKNVLSARFGDKQPRGGVLNKRPILGGWIDTYGCGNCHTSVFQYSPKDKRNFNRPMPFPSDFRLIIKFLSKNKGKTLNVGLKSDPFMWMELKYTVTKKLIRLANKWDIKLNFHTMSDLVAHDAYVDLLKGHNHSVVMNLGCGNDREERSLSPGAASLKRRLQALIKLSENAIHFEIISYNKKKVA